MDAGVVALLAFGSDDNRIRVVSELSAERPGVVDEGACGTTGHEPDSSEEILQD